MAFGIGRGQNSSSHDVPSLLSRSRWVGGIGGLGKGRGQERSGDVKLHVAVNADGFVGLVSVLARNIIQEFMCMLPRIRWRA